MPISEMNMSELVQFLERDDITKKQRAEAMKRLDTLSNRDKTGPGTQEEFRPPKDALEPKPKEDFKKGRQYAAYGGKLHRGRTAGLSAEKTR